MTKEKMSPRERALKNAGLELGRASRYTTDPEMARARVEMARTWIALAAAHAPQADGSYDR